MLKKVGIVAAAATAAMIALSPLAFAHHDDHDGETTNVYVEESSEERNQSNDCDFDQEISNASGLIPITLLVDQEQSGNCVNTGDDAESDDEDEVAPVPAPPVAP